jgi:hypothetical protein
MAGLRYWINPAVAVDLDYRYFATTETAFLSTNVGRDRIHSDYRTHNLIASLVYRFGTTPPYFREATLTRASARSSWANGRNEAKLRREPPALRARPRATIPACPSLPT